MGVNITEQRRQQNELAQSREMLRELATYINTAREEQRACIAREAARRARRHAHLDQARHPAHQPAQRRCGDQGHRRRPAAAHQDSIDTVRSIRKTCARGWLDHLGLRSALEAELQRFSARTEIACELVAGGFEAQLSPARHRGTASARRR